MTELDARENIRRNPKTIDQMTAPADAGKQKVSPRHAIGSGKDAGKRAHHRHKLRDDDDRAAVP